MDSLALLRVVAHGCLIVIVVFAGGLTVESLALMSEPHGAEYLPVMVSVVPVSVLFGSWAAAMVGRHLHVRIYIAAIIIAIAWVCYYTDRWRIIYVPATGTYTYMASKYNIIAQDYVVSVWSYWRLLLENAVLMVIGIGFSQSGDGSKCSAGRLAVGFLLLVVFMVLVYHRVVVGEQG